MKDIYFWPTKIKMTLPNAITFTRLLLALIAAVFFAYSYAEALAALLFVLATVLDAVDGWAARTFSQCSDFGKWVDPIVDKIIIALIYATIAMKMHSTLFWIFLALILLREAVVSMIRGIALKINRYVIPSEKLGRLKMISQSFFGNMVLIYAYWFKKGFIIGETFLIACMAVIILITYWSGYAVLRTAYDQIVRRDKAGTTNFNNDNDKKVGMVSGK